MNARFADWDTRNPQTADYVIVSDYYDMERLAPRPAISSPPATAPGAVGPARPAEGIVRGFFQQAGIASRHPVRRGATGVVRTEEAVIRADLGGEKLSLGIADELNLKNEGIGVVPPQVIRKPAAAVRFDPIPVFRKVYRGVQLELAQWSRTLGSVLPRVVFPVSTRSEPVVVGRSPCHL